MPNNISPCGIGLVGPPFSEACRDYLMLEIGYSHLTADRGCSPLPLLGSPTLPLTGSYPSEDDRLRQRQSSAVVLAIGWSR